MNGEIMKRKELLAPAGSKESLIAAVQAGADAVYLSGKSFGARKYASNFDMEELQEAINYCHTRDVRVYVTVNTLIKNSEFKDAMSYVGALYAMDVDAIIIQDLGLLERVKEYFPDLECHASTQMTLHNVDDVRVAQSMGLSRVVLARELSLEEIQHIIDETGVEVETFIHGALCISYSGQCLMSSMIGGRSGNRGRCAQACRKSYQLVKSDTMRDEKTVLASGYLLSPKDLSVVEDFQSIVASDIYSYKIEGRMKGPEYTYQVVSIYRELLDEAIDNEGCISQGSIEAARENLKKVFNRGFTKGLLSKDPQGNRMSIDTPSNKGYLIGEVVMYDGKRQQLTIELANALSVGDDIQVRRSGKSVGAKVEHVFIHGAKEKVGSKGQTVRVPFKHKVYPGEEVYKTYDKQLAQEIYQWLNKEHIRKPIDMKITLREGQPPALEVKDDRNHRVEVLGERLVEKALKVALSEERIREQLNKIGDNPFVLRTCEIVMDDNTTVPVKEINRIRRIAIEELVSLREKLHTGRQGSSDLKDDANRTSSDTVTQALELVCALANLEQLNAALAYGIKNIYYKDMNTAKAAYDICIEAGVSFSLQGANILHDGDLDRVKALLNQMPKASFVTGHVGGVTMVDQRQVMGSYSLNIFNSNTAKFYSAKGLKSIQLSPELTVEEVKGIHLTQSSKEMMVFGRQALMTMNYCPVMEMGECQSKQTCQLNQYGLVDEKGGYFQLFGMDCRHVQVLNGPYLNILAELDRLEKSGITRFVVEFHNEDRSFVNGALSIVTKAFNKEVDYKIDEEWLRETYDIGFTNGHFKRGVE
jgi:putative protease